MTTNVALAPSLSSADPVRHPPFEVSPGVLAHSHAVAPSLAALAGVRPITPTRAPPAPAESQPTSSPAPAIAMRTGGVPYPDEHSYDDERSMRREVGVEADVDEAMDVDPEEQS